MFSNIYIIGLWVNHLSGLPWVGWDRSWQCFWPDLVKNQVGLSKESKGGILLSNCHVLAPACAVSLLFLGKVIEGAYLSVNTTILPSFPKHENKEKLSRTDTIMNRVPKWGLMCPFQVLLSNHQALCQTTEACQRGFRHGFPHFLTWLDFPTLPTSQSQEIGSVQEDSWWWRSLLLYYTLWQRKSGGSLIFCTLWPFCCQLSQWVSGLSHLRASTFPPKLTTETYQKWDSLSQ